MKKEEREKLRELLKKKEMLQKNNNISGEEYYLLIEQIDNIIINDFTSRDIEEVEKEEIIERLKNKYKGYVIYNKDNKSILQYEDIIEEYEEFNEGETIEAFIDDFILGINSNCEMIEEKDVLYYEAFEEFKR